MPTGGPDEKVSLHVIGPLPPIKRGHQYILVMVGFFTKAVESEPVG